MIKRLALLSVVIIVNIVLVFTKALWLPLANEKYQVVRHSVDNLKETIVNLSGSQEPEIETISFNDQALETALKDALKVQDRALNKDDMSLLRGMDLKGKAIQDLSGIEHAKNLTRVSFSENPIQSIDALANMPQLTYVDLSYIEAKNLNPLLKIESLSKVVLSQSPYDYKNSAENKTVLEMLGKMGVEIIWIAPEPVVQEQVAEMEQNTQEKDNTSTNIEKEVEEEIIFGDSPIVREWKSSDGQSINAKLIATHNSHAYLLTDSDQIAKWRDSSLTNQTKKVYDHWAAKKYLTSQPILLRKLRAVDPNMKNELLDKNVALAVNVHTMYMSGSKKLFITFGENRTDTYGLIELETMDIISWFGYDPMDPEVQYYMEDQNKILMVKAAWEDKPIQLLKVDEFIRVNGKIDQSDEARLKLVNTRLIQNKPLTDLESEDLQTTAL